MRRCTRRARRRSAAYTEHLEINFRQQGTNLRAAVFYPSGGLLETELWTAQRNRPEQLARVWQRAAAPMTTIADFKEAMAKAGKPLATMDVNVLGRYAIDQLKAGKFVVSHNLDKMNDLLIERAHAIGRGEMPPGLHAYED